MNIVKDARSFLSTHFLEEYIVVQRRLSKTEQLVVDGTCLRFPEGIEADTVRARLNDEEAFINSFMNAVEPGDVVYDIGAQYGMYSVLAHVAASDVFTVAFEPMAGPYYRTRRNLEANDVAGVAIQTALTNDTKDLPSWLQQSGADIRLRDGDSLREERDLPVPSVIKMDIEGAEKYALDGLFETISDETCRTVFVELHPEGCFDMTGYESVGLSDADIDSVKRLLRDAGFSISKIGERDETEFWHAER